MNTIFYITTTIILLLCHFINPIYPQVWTEKCPSQCICMLDSNYKKSVICNTTIMTKIPVLEMDPRVEVSTIN